MLALLLERSLRKRLAGKCSAPRAFELLEPCRLNRYPSPSGSVAYTVTSPSKEQRAILSKLRLQKLADDEWLHEHLNLG